MIYSISEGQQAEAYKDRKAREAEASLKKEKDDYYKRYAISRSEDIHTSKFIGSKGNTLDDKHYQKYVDKDMNREDQSTVLLNREYDRRKAEGITKLNASANRTVARDAINRHMRRHPNQYKESCGIFYNVTFI